MLNEGINTPTKKELRKFGVVIFICLEVVGTFLLGDKANFAFGLWGVGLASIAIGLSRPEVLRIPYRMWMKLGLIMGFITNHIILAVMFYLAVTPIGILMRVLGWNTVQTKIDKHARSYWIKKGQQMLGREQYEKMF
jgi:hypothetical protein